jgi:hypothetical protein
MNIKNIKLLLTIFIILILSLTFVSAGYFEVEIDPIKNEVYPDEYATFDISVTNYFDHKETFTFSQDPRWLLIQDKQISALEPNQTETSRISLKPRSLMTTGKIYSILFKVTAISEDELGSYSIPIYLKSYNSQFGEFIPSLNLYSEFDDQVDPREKFKVKLKIRNRNALNITNMDIILESDLFHKVVKESLLPQQEKTIQVTFDIGLDEVPATYALTAKIYIENKTYASLNQGFEIIPFSNIEVSEEKTREFLRIKTNLQVINNGNTASSKIIALEKNWFERIFTTSNQDFIVSKADGKSVVQWTVELEPNEETEIIVSDNYRLLFIVAILVLLCIYLYFNLRSEVILKKKAKLVHSHVKIHEGASLIKIRLFIRNRTSKKLHDVEIREKLSKLTDILEEKHSIGSPKPIKVIKGKRTTLVKWHFPHLDPYEERIITYTLESKLKLVGSIQFPRAIIKFKNVDGKVNTTGSNKATLIIAKKK